MQALGGWATLRLCPDRNGGGRCVTWGQNEAARDGAVVFVAVELSRTSWLLASQASSPSGKVSSHRLEGGDIAGLLALLRRLQAREQRADGGEAQVVLGYEA